MNNLSQQKIQDKLKLLAPKMGLTVNDLRVILALERAVARIEAEPKFVKHIIFKGGFLLFKSVDTNRYTRDVDALAHQISQADISQFMPLTLQRDLSDCLWFRDIQEHPLPNQGPYGGLQFSVAFQISDRPPSDRQIKKLSRIHIDIGFGDSIQVPREPKRMESVLPGFETVSWLVYPLESVFAEKLEAILRRGSANSRAKDVHDLPLLFDKCQDKDALLSAIKMTFSHRGMALPESFVRAVQSFDTNMLENAWDSVLLMGPKTQFQETMAQLLERLETLDRLFKRLRNR